MALTESREGQNIRNFELYQYKVDGIVQNLYNGAILADDATSGMIIKGADTAGLKFRGIANQELIQSEIVTDGDNEICVIPKGSGSLVLLPIVSSVDETNLDDNVYIVDDENVDLLAEVVQNILVGQIRVIKNSNLVWVEI